jgi:ABC-type branched-subunit amino acid transport system ATPase component
VGVTADPGLISTTLPYGEQRRVEIARALATQPTLLLLDEPTAGMNSVESGALGDLLIELQLSGITLMLIEHNMELVLRYCQGATVMNFGRVLASGPPEQCLADPDVRDAYFGKSANAKRV